MYSTGGSRDTFQLDPRITPGVTSSCINAVHYRVARDGLVSERGTPFKAKIRRNDRLTLVAVPYPWNIWRINFCHSRKLRDVACKHGWQCKEYLSTNNWQSNFHTHMDRTRISIIENGENFGKNLVRNHEGSLVHQSSSRRIIVEPQFTI